MQERLAAARDEAARTKAALEAAVASNETLKQKTDSELARLQNEVAILERTTQAATAEGERKQAAYDAENLRLRAALALSQIAPRTDPAELDAAKRDTQQVRQQLASANEQIAGLRSRDTVARELEDRVRQLQADKVALEQHAATLATREDLDRAAIARAETDEKLAIVLRAYAQIARERDDLREKIPERAPEPAAPAIIASSPPTQSVGRSRTISAPAYTPAPEAVRRASLAVAPTNPYAGRPAFSHRIAPGETLSSISERYYGTPSRWPEIVAANPDVLPDQRSFAAGKMLRIP